MYERPCRPTVGFMFSQHALALHDSLQPVRTDSPLTHRIMGSVGLCETLWWEMIYCNCILLLYLLCFKIMLHGHVHITLQIMWILCMYIYKNQIHHHFVHNTQLGHKHTICMRYCIPQCTTHDLTFHFQSDKWTANHNTIFNITFLDTFFWSCCQNVLNWQKQIYNAKHI